ncbi:phage tail protein [Metabacillus fastidiosus]|uniref:phage tail protein n=1 Tax=Metabacillus fastidiosus TaxID=1458 RepID=UPI000826C68B|nr:tail fiber protein [Metabacillus fastidiosus]MED4461868.1 phage tail protein [Metabacillus fastidiosus]
MAERFGFFDPIQDENGQYDREYNAQEFSDYFKALVTTGLMKGAGNELAVTTNGTSMVTTVNTGVAFILGRFYENDSVLSLTHDTETLGNSRIDRIVIRMDLSTEARHVKAFIKKGVPSVNPVAPALIQTPNFYEISLVQVKVIGGQTYISTTNVTNERGKDIICPWAGSRILPNFDDVALEDLVNSIGAPNGLASLDASGKVPQSQLNIFPPADASLTVKGIVQLSNAITSTSVAHAATPSAVKSAYDLANGVNGNLNYWIGASLSGDPMIMISRPRYPGSERPIEITAYAGASSPQNYNSSFNGVARQGYCTALGADAQALAYCSTAIGAFSRARNMYDGVLGTSVSDGNTHRWIIPGSLSVAGTKNFEIPHPAPHKLDTHVIRHGAVESPTAGDTLYRFTIEAITDGQQVELQLPDYFQYLNTNVDVWVNGHRHFGRAFGEVVGDKLLVTCEKAGQYKVLVIGTRNDENVQDWHVRGVEREIGESWLGETYMFEDEEIINADEIINITGEEVQ